MTKQYFPIMRVSDIVQCLDALDIRVSDADLLKPQPNTVLRLFETLADLLMNIQFGRLPGQLAQDQNSFTNGIERILEDTTDHPELHRDSFTMMMFFRQVSKVMLNIGVKNFCLRDLTHPEPGRIRMLLSAIINFARFREERLALFEELTAQTDELVKVKTEHLNRKETMTEKVNSIQLQLQQEQPVVDQLTLETKEMAEQLKEMKIRGDGISSDVSKMKQERSEFQEQLQSIQSTLQLNKQEVTRLRSRIVKNPEQLKRSIQDMTVSLQSLKSACAGSERQSRDIQIKIESLSVVEQDLQACVVLLEECELEYKNLELAKQRVYSEKEQLERKQAHYREMLVKEQQLNRQKTASMDKLARLHSQLTAKQESASNKLRKFRQEWEDLSEDGEQTQLQIEQYSEQIAELKNKIGELKSNHDTETSAAQNDMTEIKNLMSSYVSDFKYLMNDVDQIPL